MCSASTVRAALAQVQSTLHGRGRVVLRASGTEPLVRVTVEGDDAAEVQRLTTMVQQARATGLVRGG